MRILIGMGLVAVSLLLAGCRLPVRPQPTPAPAPAPGSPSPFPTGPSTSEGDGGTPGTPTSLPPRVNGFLSGQVLDGYNRRQPSARIEVIDLDDAKEKAPLVRTAGSQGYFDIKGLNPGHRYMLIARVGDGGRALVGRARVIPPNPRVAIYVDEDSGPAPASATSPAHDKPEAPAKGDTPPEKPAPEKPAGEKPADKAADRAPAKPAGPAATLEPPVKSPAVRPEAEKGPQAGAGGPPPVTKRQQIAREPAEPGGFEKYPPSPNVSMPGHEAPAPSRAPDANPRYAPPPAPTRPDRNPETSQSAPQPPEEGPMASRPAPAQQSPDIPETEARVPSCIRVGKRLYNFALYDIDGNKWEMRKQRKGRLVLLDFWFTTCRPCQGSIPHLKDLQSRYGSYGLSVVGIAYEKGTPAEQAAQVRAAKGRWGINYTTLLGSGPRCPVKTQLEVTCFPTVVLVDETGTILFRSEGLDDMKLRELDFLIRRHLHLPLQ